MKEGYDRLLNALNKAIIITKKNAHTAVEMWIVAVDYFHWNIAFQHPIKIPLLIAFKPQEYFIYH